MVTVLAPYAEDFDRAHPTPLAARLNDLAGVSIGFVANGFVATGILHDYLRREMAALGVTPVVVTRRFYEPLAVEVVDELAGSVAAVVGGLCNTSPSTIAGVMDGLRLEAAGLPTVTFATLPYLQFFQDNAEVQGVAELRRIGLPFPLEGAAEAWIGDVAAAAYQPAVSALVSAATPAVQHLELP